MSDLEEMKNKAEEADLLDDEQESVHPAHDQHMQQGQGMKRQAMDQARKRMDVNGDGEFDAEDAKTLGEDAVNKVKGLFKKD